MAERVRQPTVGGGRSLAALICLTLLAATTPGYADAQMCIGDCNGDGMVEINELVLAVNIALGAVSLSECPSLDDGQGMVTVDRLVAAVNSALCDCGMCATPGPGTPTPTPTGEAATPTATPTGGESVSMWTVDNYDVASSNCAGVVDDAVRRGLEAEGPDFTVRQSGDQVEIEDSNNNTFDGTVDPDGTVHVQQTRSDSIGPCDYDVGVDASANLSTSPTTASYDAAVNFSGFLCVGFSDCSLQITARWRRLDNGS